MNLFISLRNMLLLKLLYLFYLTNISMNLKLSNLFLVCGKYTVDMLQMPLLYRSYKNAVPLGIKISSENDLTGPFGTISVGFFVQNDIVQCIAVKFIKGYHGNRIFKKSRYIMEQIQEKLVKPQRMHLIELFDTGNTLRYNENIMIMELGIETFHERLYKRIDSYKNDEEMTNIICALTVPIKEIHQVAIHVNINPQNYLYVSENGTMLLKLKDFGNAKLIHSDDNNESYLFEVDALDAFTSFRAEYTGPEHYQPDKEISTKFDIWSLGMIIIEIHIDRLRFKQGKDSLNEQNREVFLRELGNLYLGFERNRTGGSSGLNKIEEVLKNNSWIKQYKNAINIVLELWLKFQKTALLVTNLLHNQRALRLTAQGILNYLDDSCNLEELMPIKNAKDLRIFNTLNFGDFKRMVVQKMRVNRLNVWKSDHREMKSEYAQMSASLKAIIGAQQQHIESMDAQRQLFEICEKE